MTVGRIPSVEGGIQPTIVDAKGDIIAATAADTVARLAVGANDTILVADSSQATGLKWAAPASGGMTLLSTTTLSGASTTISGISGAFNDLLIIVSGVTNATANGSFYAEPNSSSLISNTFTRADANWQVIRNSFLQLNMDNFVLRTSANNAWAILINQYASATAYKPCKLYGTYIDSGSAEQPNAGFGGLKTNSAITEIKFRNTGGNLSTGTVLIYGVK